MVLPPLAFVLFFYALALTLVGILCRFPIVVQKAGGRRGVSGPPDKLPVIAWFLESFTVATLTGVEVAPAVWTNTVITHSLFTPFRCRIGLNRSRSPLAR